MTIAEEIPQTGLKTHAPPTGRDAVRLALPFLLITLALFGPILFSTQPTLLTHPGADVTSQFRYWCDFGFSQLRQGKLALWNPHSYSGYPFFGNWQTALLYPPNWIHLFLSWPVAINWVIAIHFFLTGWFTSLWCRFRSISLIGSTLAGVIAVGAGGYYLHIYAGHLTFICAAAWTPLILLCVDGLIQHRSWWWVRLGIVAATLQILAGFPQIVYYTALIAGIYALVQLWESRHPGFVIFGLLIMGIGAAGLAAVQIAVGLDTASESVRGGGASMALASSFSLTPENYLTLLVPHFLGDMSQYHPYFGRWFLWETCIFVGSAALCLALAGMGDQKNYGARVARFMCILSWLLALGSSTGLFAILYKYIPLYNSFRVSGRFGFFLTLFLAMLAGFGYDRLSRNPAPSRRLAAVFLIPGLLAIAVSLWMSAHPAVNARFWDRAMDRLYDTGETILPAQVHTDPDFRRDAPVFSNHQFLTAGRWMALAGALMFMIPRHKWAVHALAIAAALEIVVFDVHQLDSQPPDLSMPAAWQTALADVPDGERVYVPDLVFTNSGAMNGQDDIWGYDPFMPRRYAEFMAMTQGKDPDTTGYSFSIHKISPLLKMLRLGLYINEGDKPPIRLPDALPRVLIVHHWKLTPTRADSFAAMQDPSFDPSQTVLLETPPTPLPVEDGGYSDVQITVQETDRMDIVAYLQRPGILLITDAYARGWHVRGESTEQGGYQLLPADWTLRAIPLSAGHHALHLVYAPTSFAVGLLTTWIAIPIFALWVIIPAIRQKRHFAFAYAIGLFAASVAVAEGKFGDSRFSDYYNETHPPAVAADTGIYPAEDVIHLPITDAQKNVYIRHFQQCQASLPPGFCAVPEYPYVVIGNESLETVRRYARHDVAWTASLLKQDYFPQSPDPIQDVWVVRDTNSYRYYSDKRFSRGVVNDFGFYSPQDRALVVNMQTGYGTVAVGFVDAYLDNFFPTCPHWFHVGMEGLYWLPSQRDGHIYSYPNWRLGTIQEGVRLDRLMPFKDLITGDPHIIFQDHYAAIQARFLCYYMQEKGLLFRYFQELQANQAADPTGFFTLQDVLGETDLYDFQSRWSEWILAQKLQTIHWVDGQGEQPQ